MITVDTATWRSPNHSPRTLPITGVVLHSCEGARRGSLPWLCNPAARVSSHYYICRDGTIYQLVADTRVAWHAGASSYLGLPDWNAFTLGIECEHKQRQDWPDVQLLALSALLAELVQRHPTIRQDRIVAHRWIAPGRKIDPTDMSDGYIRAVAEALYRPAGSPPLLGPASGTYDSAVAYLSRRTSVYTVRDVQTICAVYRRIGEAVGLDWFLALAQCAHETGSLTSFWAARPQRNPAGIGVTGYAQAHRPEDTTGWAYNTQRGAWEAGVSFPTWADHAIPAHLGRLLAYATQPAARTEAQASLVRQALTYRDLPAQLHGSAPTLAGLGGTWAADTGYGARVAAKVRELRRG